MKVTDDSSAKLPQTFRDFVARFPELGMAHEQVAQYVSGAGPLDPKVCSLIKMGICLGAGLDSAFRSHVRRAMAAGASPNEIEQAVILGMNTVGFPRTVAAWQWAWQQMNRSSADAGDAK